MLGQKMLINLVLKQVMKAIEKASDKRIASDHERRIKKLEKVAHPRRDFVTCDCCKKKLKDKK